MSWAKIALLLLLGLSPAMGQTSGGFISGAKLPASQLNSALGAKTDWPQGKNCSVNSAGCLTLIVPSSFGIVDLAAWNKTLYQVGTNLTTTGTAVLGSANQFAVTTQVNIPAATGAAAAYEKAAVYNLCQTNDPSTAVISRACVGTQTSGNIAATNTQGQAWGAVSGATIVPGGDGQLVAHEFDVVNNGIDQPTLGTQTQKIGLEVVPSGTNPSTAGIVMISGGSTFHKGYYVQPGALVTVGADANASAFELQGLWRIKPDGTQVQQSAVTGVNNAWQSTANGSIVSVFGVLPTVGGTSDAYSLNFNFANAAGTQYNGGQVVFSQPAAGAGTEKNTVSLGVARARVMHAVLTANGDGHIIPNGPSVPSLTAGCNGAGSSIATNSTDVAGSATGQTAAATTCTLSFGTSFVTASYCTTSGAQSAILTQTAGLSTLVVTFASTANFVFTWQCFGA